MLGLGRGGRGVHGSEEEGAVCFLRSRRMLCARSRPARQAGTCSSRADSRPGAARSRRCRARGSHFLLTGVSHEVGEGGLRRRHTGEQAREAAPGVDRSWQRRRVCRHKSLAVVRDRDRRRGLDAELEYSYIPGPVWSTRRRRLFNVPLCLLQRRRQLSLRQRKESNRSKGSGPVPPVEAASKLPRVKRILRSVQRKLRLQRSAR
ncbi:hypothetical protein B0H15DRAFT_810755 [Mycena belliarum]|uniref:Uncharacterized protein n=1 Tax=Mycena belliarum TaxID=1033014 RepID=A0AAD6UGQ6_9AGAR|nr:hypothetical protein B0H15DRAFT_810755 [Mycena belliae]